MRLIVFILFALAFGKMGTQAYLRHQSTSETIISAYREQAVAACRRHLGATGYGETRTDVPARPSIVPGQDMQGLSVELVIGKQDLNVRLWQTSHSNWSARYSDPFLIVRLRDNADSRACEYDIRRGVAIASGDRRLRG